VSYIRQTLLKDEQVLFETRPHWIVFSSSVYLFIFACFIWLTLDHIGFARDRNHQYSIFMWLVWLTFAAAVIQWIRMWIFYQFSDYGITNKRAIMKMGWISRDAFETFLERIEGTRVDQSILGRILNYGTLIVVGTGGTHDAFPFVPSVLQFRHRLQQAMDQATHSSKN
jgi:uncharacterized membrane protein YdbT with pleckstrin-like domain